MKIIPVVGFNQPIVVDKKGVIVKGHARYAAAIQLGMTEVPCIVTDADEESIKLDRIADNKISEFSEWVNDELLHEVDMLNVDFDLSELGLPVASFDDMPMFEEEDQEDDEQRRQRFQKYLEENEAPQVRIADEKQLRRASEEQREIGTPANKYYRVTCEKCGHTMYVKEGEAMEI